MKAETITGVNEMPLEEGEKKKGKAEKKAGKRIGYNYIVVKSFKESQKNDVVKCLYIKSLTRWGFCVIKEGSYGDTKDKHGRDIIDRLKWQEKLHKELQKKLRIPRLLDSFEENGNFYLVIELIRGKSLTSIVRKYEKRLRTELLNGGKLGNRFLDYLIQIIELLAKLHENGVVHRDATGGNFMIMKSDKVALIDMELSYSLGDQFPTPPFELGTYGYMSPQQEVTQCPTPHEDIFSAGAVIMQVFTSMSPSKLTQLPGEALERRVKFFIPDKELSELVIRSLDNGPEKRPSLQELRSSLLQYKKDKLAKLDRTTNGKMVFAQTDILEIIQDGINTLSSPLMADKEKGWFSENTKLPPNPEKSKINKAWYGSFYNGVAGVIYYLCEAKKVGLDISACEPYIDKGFDLIHTKYINESISSHPGLYHGSAGIAITMQEAMKQGLIPVSAQHIRNIHDFLEKKNQHYDYLNGIAGQGLAIIHSTSFLQATGGHYFGEEMVEILLQVQKQDGSWPRGVGDTGKRIHLSFAYGISGVLYYLLNYYRLKKDPKVLIAVRKGLQCLMTQASDIQGALIWRKERKDHYSWWCSGEVGIALTFIRAFDVLKDASYRVFAIRALQNYSPEITENNFSQCHGLSSLGEVYLEAHKVLGGEEWRNRATWIANLLLHCRRTHAQYGTWWQVDHERQPTAGFMNGNSGVMHFLLRYCFSDKIHLPLEPSEFYEWNSAFQPEMNDFIYNQSEV